MLLEFNELMSNTELQLRNEKLSGKTLDRLVNDKYTKPWIELYSSASEFHLNLKRKSCSTSHFAVTLMLKYFETFELKDPEI